MVPLNSRKHGRDFMWICFNAARGELCRNNLRLNDFRFRKGASKSKMISCGRGRAKAVVEGAAVISDHRGE
ncbi:hypothetical protein SAMN05216228_107410 [Rhizobium tibeticum]|uniref:Uncharacterized protein n=1 Tax=Rhizobium tibeticum TaxID=501024 RepID=A0A1H8WQG5_9HYPH|nr:hypothetical protein RTCCBAU85039_6660 [Rhizobium tibeticum]SEP29964.1 hypothetical protein SAMN05216228_107410 [Rhizobium tibeticum]